MKEKVFIKPNVSKGRFENPSILDNNLNSWDVSNRINELLQLEENWYQGIGKALNREQLLRFETLFNAYFDKTLACPAIFPTIDGNIQLEWKKNENNIIVPVNLFNLSIALCYYHDRAENMDKEFEMKICNKADWIQFNSLIAQLLNGQ